MKLEAGKYYLTKDGKVGKVTGSRSYDYGHNIISNIPTNVTDMTVKAINPYVLWNSLGTSTNAFHDNMYTVIKEVNKEDHPEYFL